MNSKIIILILNEQKLKNLVQVCETVLEQKGRYFLVESWALILKKILIKFLTYTGRSSSDSNWQRYFHKQDS